MHVAYFAKTLIGTLSKKMIRTNKFLSFLTETQIHITCSIKIFIVNIFQEIDKNK